MDLPSQLSDKIDFFRFLFPRRTYAYALGWLFCRDTSLILEIFYENVLLLQNIESYEICKK